MGTKRCEHCGRALSQSASVCPGCGRSVPSPVRRWTAALVALLFVLALLLALFQAFAGKGEAAVLRVSDGAEAGGQVSKPGGQVSEPGGHVPEPGGHVPEDRQVETPAGVRGLRWWSAGEGDVGACRPAARAPHESQPGEAHT